jgi:4-amino-4-deoxychorismate lyase
VQTALPATDRGLQFGDGLFETMTVVSRRIRFFDLHWERLLRGCAQLRFPPPNKEVLIDELRQQASDSRVGLIKLIWTRGSATARGYAPRGDETGRRILFSYPPPTPARGTARLWLAQAVVSENAALAGLKTLNRLDQVVAQTELQAVRDAQRIELDEALMCTSQGMLVSATMGNLFWVRGGRLQTPALSRCGVAGVMRAVVLREARALAWPVEEVEVPASVLSEASEVFLTNSRLGLWPVESLCSEQSLPLAWPVGGRTQSLRLRVAGLSA